MANEETVEAVKKALSLAPQRKFEESVEIAINLKDVDLSVPKNRIQEDIILPSGRGKDVRVCLFGGAEMALKAKNVADLIISPEDFNRYMDDKKVAKKLARDYDYFVAEAPLMATIGKRMGVVLGPRGKIPKPLQPGIDPAPAITTLKKTTTVRSREKRTFQTLVGTRRMKPEEIAENVDAVLNRVIGKLEKGKLNLDSAYVKTTMGPAVRIM
ncbi:MAG: 50S ribosomal protein L1 [Candidatus Thermoplasmatota archaeon]|nr:50S ribosomal protein L1 [Candidatus Sysuiplasma jiujiangense]MBX8639297.1 50S ribosomal protein L1 [Candidatus Sysuiplasma jiujiangense]MCL5252612.1 50S ribosomal protein L1 [Candidatus Thermoplasmatota archaeon]